MKKRNRMKRIIVMLAMILIGVGATYKGDILSFLEGENKTVQVNRNEALADVSFDGTNQVIAINDNKPDFKAKDLMLEKGSWQTFSNLDDLNRVGVANAMLGRELMPKTDREALYVDPTGWRNKKLASGWLYNRCHLIGFQLTGENNNLKNLMTGTRSFNTPGMLTYENKVASYLRTTKNHVRYQVKPVFKGNELVARGVQMQAQSVEDNRIAFNVFVFNVEQGVDIDYSTGKSMLK
ncbi:DNA/RNA non-specific endonuclease [Listeria riparia]|uniref:DNA-entry nuclease n=1 Tax=Listeria riparia FSL S10-1204 TaxID=1265816 RepID=W7DC70_9LIST|nr:DNA/RNA non-specific endonuclease [Listeria riparia]EUJ42858.1 DNA-entry nuclease [Listeria riparia FSL S10-1204]